jgi:hypothetical protein
MQEQLPTTAGKQEVGQCRSNCRGHRLVRWPVLAGRSRWRGLDEERGVRLCRGVRAQVFAQGLFQALVLLLVH